MAQFAPADCSRARTRLATVECVSSDGEDISKRDGIADTYRLAAVGIPPDAPRGSSTDFAAALSSGVDLLRDVLTGFCLNVR